MSDKDIAKIYTAVGTGTGTHPVVLNGTGDGGVPADERDLVESKQALKKMFIVLCFTVTAAVGQFLETAAPALSKVLDDCLPDWSFLSINAISTVILTVSAFLQGGAARKHKVAVVKALVTEPTQELRESVEKKLGG